MKGAIVDDQLQIDDRRQALDRRQAERVKTLLKARIYFNNRLASYDCVVKNISPFGAKVAIDKNATVPEDFELEIPMRGKTYKAKMIWRDAEGIDMDFVEDNAPHQTDNALEKLRAENHRLKQALLTLTKRLEDLGQDVPRIF